MGKGNIVECLDIMSTYGFSLDAEYFQLYSGMAKRILESPVHEFDAKVSDQIFRILQRSLGLYICPIAIRVMQFNQEKSRGVAS